MLTNREMVNFQKWDFFILLTYTINCVTTGARKGLLSIYVAGFPAASEKTRRKLGKYLQNTRKKLGKSRKAKTRSD